LVDVPREGSARVFSLAFHLVFVRGALAAFHWRESEMRPARAKSRSRGASGVDEMDRRPPAPMKELNNRAVLPIGTPQHFLVCR
jgi:hypothetical protein